jgi:3,4-dihydroxy 2-butanone 4-phosphate synthase/GTP cyclohydrolase II
MGLDTVEANEKLGFPADLRNYGMGAQILNDLGVKQIRLITNNPRKIAGLKGYGIEIVDRVPLLIEATDYNSVYLATKAQKLGHLLLQSYLITVAIDWEPGIPEECTWSNSPEVMALPGGAKEFCPIQNRYERLEQLREWARNYDLLLQEETRPVAIAVFGKASLIVHLGFDQPSQATADWYREPTHPYLEAIAAILEQIAKWPHLSKLEFLIASGSDPLTNLQIQLKRQTFAAGELLKTCQQLQPQTIYQTINN